MAVGSRITAPYITYPLINFLINGILESINVVKKDNVTQLINVAIIFTKGLSSPFKTIFKTNKYAQCIR